MNSCSNKVMIKRSLDLTISMAEKNYIQRGIHLPYGACHCVLSDRVGFFQFWEWRSMQRHRSWCLQSSSAIWDALKYPAWPPLSNPGGSYKSSGMWVPCLGWGVSKGTRQWCDSNWIKPLYSLSQNDKCLCKDCSFGHSFYQDWGSMYLVIFVLAACFHVTSVRDKLPQYLTRRGIWILFFFRDMNKVYCSG